MGRIATVLSVLQTIKNKVFVREVKAEALRGQNVYAETFGPPGYDAAPAPGDAVLLVPKGESGAVASVGSVDITNAPAATGGDRRVYSVDGAGAVAATIWLREDGSVELVGDGDRAVSFQDLADALALFVAALNSHTHTGVTAGGGVTGGPSAPLTLDISAAKVEEVKLP